MYQRSWSSHKVNYTSYQWEIKEDSFRVKKTRRYWWDEPDISNPPFIFNDNIAELSNDSNLGFGLVVPIPHYSLVETAKYKGKDLCFKVPQHSNLSSSLYISTVINTTKPIEINDRIRHAPEFVHVRTRISNDIKENLNDQPNVTNIVSTGGYNALHYIDFTGDWWLKPHVLSLQ